MKRVLALAMVMLMLCGFAAFADGERTLREGKYVVNEEIPAGTYTITCIETEGEKIKDAYGSLGEALDALDDTQGYGSLMGALGGMMDEYAVMTVEILGDYGDVLRSYTLKTGDTMDITLKEGTALKISEGSCTLLAK